MSLNSDPSTPLTVPTRDLVPHIGGGVSELDSSADRPWSGIMVRRLLNPPTFENPAIPAIPDFAFHAVSSPHEIHGARCLANEEWVPFTCARGDWAIVPPHRTLGLRWETAGTSQLPHQSTHLYLDPGLIGRVAEETVDVDPTHVEVIPRLAFQDPLIDQLALALLRELEDRRPGASLFAETVANLLAIHLLREHCVDTAKIPEYRGGLAPNRLRQIEELVMARLDDPPSLDELAREADMSVYHFCRQFKKSTGSTPHQYVLKQRLDRACELLSHSQLPIIQVALATGFGTPTHFSAAFRKVFGETPSNYRRKTRS